MSNIPYKTCPICASTCSLSVKRCKCGLDFAKAGEMLKDATCKESLTVQKKSTRTDAQKEWDKKQTAIQATVNPDNDLGLVSFKDRMKKKDA